MAENKELSSRGWGVYVYCILSMVLLTSLVLMLVSCAQNDGRRVGKLAGWSAADLSLKTKSSELLVASYNVLNLFDAKHDEGKEDYTFLPTGFAGKEDYCKSLSSTYYKKQCLETDWSETKVVLKLNQIKKVIDAVGDLPDLLGLQEIENANVTGKLAKVLGYGEKFLVTKSPDKRGIDVALLYREDKMTLVEHEELVLQGPEFPPSFTEKPTRNILRAHFAIGRGMDTLGVYVNHWPSQAAPPEKRMVVARVLKKEIEKQRTRLGAGNYHVVILGDFNTLDTEWPNAFHHVMQDPNWDGSLIDVQAYSNKVNRYFNRQMPPNSYFYSGSNLWEKLDRILVSKNLDDKKGIEVLPKTFRILASPFMMKPYEVTKSESFFFGSLFSAVSNRYDFTTEPEAEAGFSDHLPIAVKIALH